MRISNKHQRYPNLPNTLLAVAAVVLILRIITALTVQPFDFGTHFSPSHLRIDSLLAGVWLAYQYHFNPAFLKQLLARHRYPLSIASIACLTPAAFLPMDHIFVYTIGLTLIYVAFSILLLLVLFPEKPAKTATAGLCPRGLAAIGRSSYGIYLWQGPVVFVCEAARAKAAAAGSAVSQISFFFLCLPIAVFTGILMTKLIETPFLALREKIVPRRARGVAFQSPPCA
jgi:peptidoglycan/LPS O-acetylase OafA/YrhL